MHSQRLGRPLCEVIETIGVFRFVADYGALYPQKCLSLGKPFLNCASSHTETFPVARPPREGIGAAFAAELVGAIHDLSLPAGQ